LEVPESYDDGEDIIIKALPKGLNSDPDVFISKKNKFPKDSSNAEWACSAYGKDTCSINNADIKRGDIFYIGIKCFQMCNFNLIPLLTEEYELENGEEL